ncbi:MAG: RNA-binding S4 domain-containing protein [Alphaproteobacteria bacterium]|nr:RNA-binding S4 domain-containing protein [Alphaproteobacteria bacterium]
MSAAPRLDKWLWYARFFKSRSLACRLCAAGRVRINGISAKKASAVIRLGDVITFVQGPRVRVVRVVDLGGRRGPAPEARALYADLAPEAHAAAVPARVGERQPGSGRPTKSDRRRIDRLKAEA